jgi:beta-hydroxylase
MVYSTYNLDPLQFDFLQPLQSNWENIRDEFLDFCQAPDEILNFAYSIMGPKSRMIKTADTGHPSKYSAFGLWYRGDVTCNLIASYGIRYNELSVTDTVDLATKIQQQYFPKLVALLTSLEQKYPKRIRTAYFGTFHPGMRIKLHVNDNRQFYRGYLGLIVPKGDVAMRICDNTLYWREGEFMVLDHSYPHCPHNNTNEKRTVLVVDFIKPELNLNQALAADELEFAARMAADPKSLGVFGGNDYVSDEIVRRYGMEEQLEWNQELSGH